MFKNYLISFFAAAMLTACASAVDTPPQILPEYLVLKKDKDAVSTCNSFASSKMECSFSDGDEPLRPSWTQSQSIPVSMLCQKDDRLEGIGENIFERMSDTGVCGRAYMRKRRYEGNVMLYVVQFAIVRTSYKPGTSTSISVDDGIVKHSISSHLPIAPIDSPEALAYIRAASAQQIAEDESAQKKVAATKLAEEQEAAAKVTRQNSPEAKRARDVAVIHDCIRQMRIAETALLREKRVAAISGVQNMYLVHRAGEIIVQCQDSIKRAFRDYRANGGTVTSPDQFVE